MSRIKGRDTGPELLLRKKLWARGVRYRLKYRLNGRLLKGRPDLVFPGGRLAVFVDGCFWHGCPEHASMPKRNADFWEKKLKRNVEHDEEVTASLRMQGWNVLRFWEHEIETDLDRVVGVIVHTLRGNR